MAPHAEAAAVDSGASTQLHRANETQPPTAEAPVSNGVEAVPLRDQLAGLYEDNIAAKILRTAIDGLVQNVSRLMVNGMYAHDLRTPQLLTQSTSLK